MEQKDYKAFAEMFRTSKPHYDKGINEESQEGYFIWKCLVNKSADYFEKEDKSLFDEALKNKGVATKMFYREQFLEWCGM